MLSTLWHHDDGDEDIDVAQAARTLGLAPLPPLTPRSRDEVERFKRTKPKPVLFIRDEFEESFGITVPGNGYR